MADTNPEVMAMIESELKNNPDTPNPELLEKATAIDPTIGDLTARQFNARYPLQVKRAMKPRKPRKRRTKATGRAGARGARGSKNAGSRDRVRAVLLDLARDVANAQGKGDVVDVIAGIDGYVDKVVRASS